MLKSIAVRRKAPVVPVRRARPSELSPTSVAPAAAFRTGVRQILRGGEALRRQTAEEADLSVLRGALLEAIRVARTISADRKTRARLDALKARVPSMTADELRAELPKLQKKAGKAMAGVTSGKVKVKPRAAPSTLDPLEDNPFKVVEEGRAHHLYLTIQFISKSKSFGAQGIRKMLKAMNVTLGDIAWYAHVDAGFAAATALTGVSGNPPKAEIEIVLGSSMLVLMNRPDEDLLPTFYHEIYHAYERFRLQKRGSLAARPNLALTEMKRRVALLAGTPLKGDAAFAADAETFARSVESELYAELLSHSAMQDPVLVKQGSRTLGLGTGIVILNQVRAMEGEIEQYLEQIKALFGESKGGKIARQLLARARQEGLVHSATADMFEKTVDFVFWPIP